MLFSLNHCMQVPSKPNVANIVMHHALSKVIDQFNVAMEKHYQSEEQESDHMHKLTYADLTVSRAYGFLVLELTPVVIGNHCKLLSLLYALCCRSTKHEQSSLMLHNAASKDLM